MCVWKDEIKWKRGRGWPIFRKINNTIALILDSWFLAFSEHLINNRTYQIETKNIGTAESLSFAVTLF